MPRAVSSSQIEAASFVILADDGYVVIIELKIQVSCWHGGLNPNSPHGYATECLNLLDG